VLWHEPTPRANPRVAGVAGGAVFWRVPNEVSSESARFNFENPSSQSPFFAALPA
jgi:hypothetical protein